MYDIIAILIPIVIAICVVVGIRLLADTGLRKRLAETQTDADVVESVLEAGKRNQEGSWLTWGITMCSVGVALLLAGWLNLSAEEPLVYGLILVSAGVGVLISLRMIRQRK